MVFINILGKSTGMTHSLNTKFPRWWFNN